VNLREKKKYCAKAINQFASDFTISTTSARAKAKEEG
jgi:hypothetical protein